MSLKRFGVYSFVFAGQFTTSQFYLCFFAGQKFFTEDQFLERYPGDEWVDMVGMDNYGDWAGMVIQTWKRASKN